MSVRIKYDIEPEYVKPKLDDLDIISITPEQYELASSISTSEAIEADISEEQPKDDEWYNWTLSFSMQEILASVEGAEKFFKTLDTITNQITEIIKIMRLLSGGVNTTATFLKFAVKQLIKTLKELINSLTSTGIYSTFIHSDFNKTFPDFVLPTDGGYQEFIKRVNNTCLHSSDPDAPKFGDKDKVGGVIIAMLGGVSDPEFLYNMVENFKKLAKFFGFKIPYPSPALKLRATPGLYKNKGEMKLGVKLTWDAPDLPVGSFYVYKSITGSRGIPDNAEMKTLDRTKYLFTLDDPIVKITYNPLKASYSYIDFDIVENTDHFYKIYSVYGSDYLEKNPHLKYIDSPISTRTVLAKVKRECIPISELEKYANIGINGTLRSPFDFEGQWQSFTVRRMLGAQIDEAYEDLDALSDKLLGLIDTGSDAINKYLKFYKERMEDLLDIINKIKKLMVELASFSMRGTFMVMNLPLEVGGMQGFVDRFNEACNSGESTSSEVPENYTSLQDFIKNSVSKTRNAAISQFNEEGAMFGVVLLYGVPDFEGEERKKELKAAGDVSKIKRNYEQTGKAITTLLKMFGLEE